MRLDGQLEAFPRGYPPNFVAHRAPGISYFDRTGYIATIGSFPNRALLFLRPRRFGKTFTLQRFHGLEYTKDYPTLFNVSTRCSFFCFWFLTGGCLLQGLDIAKDRTVVPNQYLVLLLDFSNYLPYFKVNGRKLTEK